MAEHTLIVSTRSVRAATPWRQRWRYWIGYATAVWSLAYGVLGLYWTLGGEGFPFGLENDPNAEHSLLAHVGADAGAPIVAVLGFLGALVAPALTRSRPGGTGTRFLLAFAWIAALALLLIIPDSRLLAAAAYGLVFLVGAPIDWPPGSYLDAISWPIVNQCLLVLGGVLWAGTAVATGVRLDTGAAWATPEAAAKWGKWAVAIAVVVPLLYAITRLAWALGIPLGISEAFLRQGQESGLWYAGTSLAAVAIVGAILTLGLVQQWGEVFPRWIPYLGGKRVPPALAIVPAMLVSFIVTSAGLQFVRSTIAEGFPAEGWATVGPALLWPVWGVALVAATLAYHFRRRGRS